MRKQREKRAKEARKQKEQEKMLAERRTVEEKKKSLNEAAKKAVNDIDAANELLSCRPANTNDYGYTCSIEARVPFIPFHVQLLICRDLLNTACYTGYVTNNKRKSPSLTCPGRLKKKQNARKLFQSETFSLHPLPHLLPFPPAPPPPPQTLAKKSSARIPPVIPATSQTANESQKSSSFKGPLPISPQSRVCH